MINRSPINEALARTDVLMRLSDPADIFSAAPGAPLSALGSLLSRSDGSRMDAAIPVAFVENEISVLTPELFNKEYKDLDAKLHIPMATMVPPATMDWSYDSWEFAGKADFLADSATNFQLAEAGKVRKHFQIQTIKCAYGWTIEEIEFCRQLGSPLDAMRAESCKRALAELENSILLSGDVAHKLPGFLTNDAVPLLNVPNGAWSAGLATPDQVVEDLNAMTDRVFIQSQKRYVADTILLPLREFRRINAMRLPNTGLTVRDFYMQTNPGVTILPLIEMSTAGASGGARAVCYKKDPNVLRGVMPMSFNQMDPQIQGFNVVVPCRQRLGGCVWFRPLAGVYADGI